MSVARAKKKAGGVVRLADVAEAAGVGVSITSRVLNNDPTVSTRAETRERILTAARNLDYRPNALARGLRLSRTMSIGIVIDLAFYNENAEIMMAAERASAEAGFVMLIADANEFAERGDVYRHMLRERRVDGILIASLLVSDEFIREIASDGLPFVVLDRAGRTAGPSVSVDEAAGMRCAVEHLIELGHERIGYLAGPTVDKRSQRTQGLREALRAGGLRAESRLIVPCPCDNDGVFEATLALLHAAVAPHGPVRVELDGRGRGARRGQALRARRPGRPLDHLVQRRGDHAVPRPADHNRPHAARRDGARRRAEPARGDQRPRGRQHRAGGAPRAGGAGVDGSSERRSRPRRLSAVSSSDVRPSFR